MSDIQENRDRQVSSGPDAETSRVDAYGEEVDLLDYVEIVVRQRWTIVWVTLLVTAGAVAPWFFRGAEEPTFWAEVNVVVEQAPALPEHDSPLKIDSGLFRNYGLSKHVLGSPIALPGREDTVVVSEYLGGSTLGASNEILRSKTAVEIGSPGFVIIRISDSDSVAAAQMAHAYVHALRRYVGDLKDRQVTEELAYVERRLEEVQSLLREAEDSLYVFRQKHLGGPGRADRHVVERELGVRQRKVNSWAKVYNTLLSHQEVVRLRAQGNDATVALVSFASGRSSIDQGWPTSKAGAGAGVGLALGCFVSFLRDYVQRLGQRGGGERLRKAYRGDRK